MTNPQRQAQQELNALKAALQQDDFDDGTIAQKLINLKIISRSPHDAPCVYCKEGLRLLADAAFGSKSDACSASSLEAARIIANALLLQDSMQQVFAELGQLDNLLNFYSKPSADHEFIGGRIFFLLTYKSKVDFVTLIEAKEMVQDIRAHLMRHASSIHENAPASVPTQQMALVETLKLLYNLASKYPAQMHFFTPTSEVLISVLGQASLTSKPLDPPIAQLLNAMAIIDWPAKFAKDDNETMLSLGRRLIEILDRSTSSLRPAQLETMLIPLITVIRKAHEMLDPAANELLRLSLLPQNEERDKPLGQSQTLAARLLRLQTSAGLTILPEAISGLLFDLSDRDATTFVHNIGYGHAAGYLMTHKIPIPEDLKTVTLTEVSGSEQIQINPVTGQRLDAETPIDMPEMTDEEKEREAERLFVLFERLKATGVMDIENPMKTAQQSGRFEQLSDSETD